MALQQTGRLGEAAEQYRRVLVSNPGCEEALANLVSVSLARNEQRAVRHYAEMLAELQPESPVALEALAALAFEDGGCRKKNPSRQGPAIGEAENLICRHPFLHLYSENI